MRKARVSIAGLFVLLCLLLPAGCYQSADTAVIIPGVDEDYVSIFNRVDELLMGDLDDTVSLEELSGQYSGREIIGLGTTLREHAGEIFFLSESCYWADPTSNGRVMKLDWIEEELPFCAITGVDIEDYLVFTGVTGDIHQWIERKIEELGIPLAAVKVKGRFADVHLSIADRLPENASEKLESVLITVNEEREWEFVGFYAQGEENQKLLSVPGHPVHLHGKTLENDYGGHVQKANSIASEVAIYPVDQYVLRNKVP